MHKILIFILLLLSPTCFAIALGKSPSGEYKVNSEISYLEDPFHSLSFNEIQNRHQGWKVNHDKIFNKGYSPSTWWLRLDIENIGNTEEYIFEVSYAVLDYIDIYVIKEDGTYTEYNLGDKLPFHSRTIEHRYFSVPLDLEPSATNRIFIRVQSTSAIQVPIRIWERNHFHAVETSSGVLHGLYMGGLLCIAIYNLLIFLVLRESTHFYYVAYVISMLFFTGSLNGWTYQYLWPNSIEWNDKAILIALNGVVLFGLGFTKNFLQLKKLGRAINLAISAWATLSIIGFVFFFFAPYRLGIQVIIPFASLSCIWALIAGLYSLKMKNKSAAIYVLAWAGLLIGGIVLALNKLDILPRNFLTDYATQIGSFFEVLLLSFALTQRINHERTLRIKAQSDALSLQIKANEELETRVSQRTEELELANRKLQELSDTDQLTGIKNRRYLDLYLKKEMVRAKRYGNPLSVMLIDIDHFKSVNDQYGHLVGDDCIKEIAKRISQQMRWPSDLTARYGGEEFCVILPETDHDGALNVASRINENIYATPIVSGTVFKQKVSASIGLYTTSPTLTEIGENVLDKADKALYLAKENGRNRVEYYSEQKFNPK